MTLIFVISLTNNELLFVLSVTSSLILYISLSHFLYLYLNWKNFDRTAIVRAGAEANNEAAHVLL